MFRVQVCIIYLLKKVLPINLRLTRITAH